MTQPRRWPGDIDGDGTADPSLTTGDKAVIVALNTKTIADADYNPDADLDRNGTINGSDAFLWNTLNGVGGAAALGSGLVSDPAGADNPFGYCGYFFSPESRLYGQRFRWYDPALGRWLQRDPLGYADGMQLYQYVRGRATILRDPFGLYDEAGHYYTTYIVATRCGLSQQNAMDLAYYSQLPDESKRFDAIANVMRSLTNWALPPLWPAAMHGARVAELLHSLHGGNDSEVWRRRKCLEKLLQDGGLQPWEAGFITHALGDAYSHTYNTGNTCGTCGGQYEKAYGYPLGHFTDGHAPDHISTDPGKFMKYSSALCRALGGTGSGLSSDEIAHIPEDGDEAIEYMRQIAISLGHPVDGFKPEESHEERMPGYAYPTMQQLDSLLDKIEGACCTSEN